MRHALTDAVPSIQRAGNGAWVRCLCCVLAFCVPHEVLAQTQVDKADAQRQIESLQRQEQERLQRDQETKHPRTERVDGMDTAPLLPKITVPALGAKCLDIAEIRIQGATLLANGERARLGSLFAGRCLAVSDIEALLGEVTKYYIDRGYITTRAYLPQQDLTQGRLLVLVVEGVVEKVVIEDGDSHSVSLLNTFPGVAGGVLNLRDLEQGIDQINRLTSNSAELEIQPGDVAGASRVAVRNQARLPWHFNIATDNQGADSTGATQVAIGGTVDNLLGFNEMLSLNHRESTPNDPKRQYAGSDVLNLSIPYGYNTWSFGSSQSKYASVIRVPSGLELVSDGYSKTDNLRLDRVVYRDQFNRATLSATVTTKESKNYLDGQFLGVSSRSLTVLDVDSSLNTRFAGGQLTLDFGYAQGVDAMGAMRDMDNLPDWAARAQFNKTKLGFNFVRPFRVADTDFSFSTQLSSQKAHVTLYGSEQISIGGLYSVRGFVRNSLSGDEGYYWRNEFAMRQPLRIGDETVSIRYYVGYDSGEVKNLTAHIPEGQLTGMVLGMSAQWQGINWDFFHTRPLSGPDGMSLESGQTWFRVSYSF